MSKSVGERGARVSSLRSETHCKDAKGLLPPLRRLVPRTAPLRLAGQWRATRAPCAHRVPTSPGSPQCVAARCPYALRASPSPLQPLQVSALGRLEGRCLRAGKRQPTRSGRGKGKDEPAPGRDLGLAVSRKSQRRMGLRLKTRPSRNFHLEIPPTLAHSPRRAKLTSS